MFWDLIIENWWNVKPVWLVCLYFYIKLLRLTEMFKCRVDYFLISKQCSSEQKRNLKGTRITYIHLNSN